MAQLSIPERRKAFKDRTLLAGLPVPDKSWYRNNSPTGSYTPMPFTKENFICGFFLSRGDYYIIRDEVVEALKQKDLFKMKSFNDPDVMYDFVWPIYAMIEKHAIMSHVVPAGWKYHMIFKFIHATAAWMRERDEKNELAWPFYPAEDWGQGNSKKLKTSLLSYRVKITVHDPDPTFFLPTNLSFLSAGLPSDPLAGFPSTSRFFGAKTTPKPIPADDNTSPARKEVTFLFLRELIDGGGQEPSNVDGYWVKQLSFARLQDVLHEKMVVEKESGMKIYFAHPLAGNRMVVIENDEQLHYAMGCLLPHAVSSIELVSPSFAYATASMEHGFSFLLLNQQQKYGQNWKMGNTEYLSVT
ncbi:hypothetical protein DM02DRAFT_625465 [Periconia macrospinosa]|uniref:Uncharacterized protein n=1 Tax=Periconia macrospinosa TaxID=97972 RepID=A0A2V1E2Q9_9PLEO|nr:hypothetical protein DM02DRAFT_625465 [Periconia macrospinosa]